MPLRILHTADLHLGMTFQGRHYPDEVRQQLVEARFEALERVVTLAGEEKCDLLIIAGDMFHRLNVRSEQVARAIRGLKRFPGIIAYLPGNHDYYEANNNFWAVVRELAFEELVLLTESRPYDLSQSGLDLALYPAPCDAKHSAENRLTWLKSLPGRPSVRWHIGIAHGTVRGVSPDLKDEYFPMEGGELNALGLQHWCLGHTHAPYPDLPETGRQPFIYCGTPEPDGFDCRHRGNAWVTELNDQGEAHSRLLPTGQFQFRELQKEIRGSGGLDLLRDELGRLGRQTLLKLKLSGVLPEDEYRDRSRLFREIADGLLYLENDEEDLSIELTPAVIEAKYPLGSFPYRLLLKLDEKGDREALQVAYRLMEGVKR